jgi:HK97 family phage major capsid protein
MKLREQIKSLLDQSRTLLEEAEQAVVDGNLDLAKEKQEEAGALSAKAEVLKTNLDANDHLDSLVPEEPVEEPVTEEKPVDEEPGPAKAHRLPFAMDNEVPEEEPADSFSGVYNIRYGETDTALKAVIKDLYGSGYNQNREHQRFAFVKYVRAGEKHLDAKEYAALKSIILMPETIKSEIQLGSSVAEIKASTLVEALGDLGGYLVPEDYRLEIIKRLMGATIVRGRARVIQTLRDGVEWPKLEGGNSLYTSAVRVTWVDETPAEENVSGTNPTFGMLRVPIHTVMARVDLSRNLLEDSAFNLLDVMADLFAEAMAIDEDAQFITGTGGGRPKGVLGNRSGAEETPETGIEEVTSGAAAALTADGLVDLVYNLHAQYRQNAVLVGSRTTHRDVRKLTDGQSQYLWAAGLQPGEPPTLLGYPFFESENVPTIAANKYPIIFGDWKGYLIADRVGMSVERVTDTGTVGTNTVALFARRRLGGQVIEPWRFQAQKVSA